MSKRLRQEEYSMDAVISKNLKRKVRSLSTQIYIQEIKDRYNGKSFGKIQKELFSNSNDSNAKFWSEYSRRFYKNSKGVPIRDEKIIKIFENEQPGTERLFNNPLWLVLENPFADLKTIDELMHLLVPELQIRLFKRNKQTGHDERKFWTVTPPFNRISMENNFDALACLLLLLREAELLERWHYYITIKWFAYELCLRLNYFCSIKVANNSFYSLVNLLYINRNNPLPDSILETRLLKKTYYRSPPNDIPIVEYNDFLSRLIQLAQAEGFVADNKEDQINFLFWADIFDKYKIFKAFESQIRSSDQNHILSTIRKACTATNKRQYIPYGHIID